MPEHEEDRWYEEYERRRERDLEAEDAERERAIERHYEKGDQLTEEKKEERCDES